MNLLLMGWIHFRQKWAEFSSFVRAETDAAEKVSVLSLPRDLNAQRRFFYYDLKVKPWKPRVCVCVCDRVCVCVRESNGESDNIKESECVFGFPRTCHFQN